MALDCICLHYNVSMHFLSSYFVCGFCPHDHKMEAESADIMSVFSREKKKTGEGQKVKEIGLCLL